ncbi:MULTISPECIES: crotonase/enoyl-CoA hydratase family protein [unclassified Mycolicibacterium]|uniref:crotonase/enoyl-CoA hydratase family protein n=1 Tax=unclassified Mycolicibacterium TaxID=2636767 RepID=UPI0012DFB872|nr:MULTISPECIES: crotonase/enoyl-CoA hydratase family protein [unclassified Mycolicibacterium]MUL82324.1 crotonase/enoyl-CoA hydratase family protein [Mycolicibacterium sp. CBMA 329]MUL88090.1 crotonase/enoyl-CoA hydratase family protein [Mycolicibacterium sp. CBMA 331]MUM02420.1 crotonase/enoyl-CoA hydratase family protein [Mycolicibacterium sp. CBMA 334]MUM24823.1 crotonase/enoyl-CoA hydratase family protein [Mycolicibacterium sp. CBMA 295]MUM38387.1 crotonase/enoyl-CoA hydratase family prot
MTTDAKPPAALLHKEGPIAVISLNRPEAMNAVNAALSVATGQALEDAQNDPDIRVVIITGAGRGFCAGADLKELAQGHRIDDRAHPEWGFAGVVQHWIDKPTIAAVNGYALGGGTEIALACDLVVIDESASLGLPEVKRGLFAAAGGVIRLQRQIPMKIALEAVLTGAPISAARAYELGLVNRVAPEGTSVEVAMQIAGEIAANAPISVRYSKQVMHRTAVDGSDWEAEVWNVNKAAIKAVFTSQDALEGPRAFAEKRTPEWQDR